MFLVFKDLTQESQLVIREGEEGIPGRGTGISREEVVVGSLLEGIGLDNCPLMGTCGVK